MNSDRKQPTTPEWRNSDPRLDFIDRKRVSIIILRPHHSGGHFEAGTGQAEMKHGWSILTSFENHSAVLENDSWDPAWFWVQAPEYPMRLR